MKTKVCKDCNIEKPLKKFSGRHRDCNSCANKKRPKKEAFTRAVYIRNRDFIDGYKTNPCIDCGNKFPSVCIDFDHVRGIKNYEVGRMRTQGHSLETIWHEIQKCDVICSNCHRIRTAKRAGYLERAILR